MTKKTSCSRPHEIHVTFSDGRQVIYTAAILALLVTDPDVIEIMDRETGEMIYIA